MQRMLEQQTVLIAYHTHSESLSGGLSFCSFLMGLSDDADMADGACLNDVSDSVGG